MTRELTRIARLVAAGALLLSFAGVASAADTAEVRVLHASPDAPAVDVYLDDTQVSALTNVPFGVISGYLSIPAGAHNVKVYATGTTTSPVIDADVTVAAGKMYTIAATGAVAAIDRAGHRGRTRADAARTLACGSSISAPTRLRSTSP